MAWVLCQDAGWGDRPDDLSQIGYVTKLAEKQILDGEVSKVSFIEYGSRRIKLVVRSSLATQLHGLSMGIDSAAWARMIWQKLKNGVKFNIADFEKHLMKE